MTARVEILVLYDRLLADDVAHPPAEPYPDLAALHERPPLAPGRRHETVCHGTEADLFPLRALTLAQAMRLLENP